MRMRNGALSQPVARERGARTLLLRQRTAGNPPARESETVRSNYAVQAESQGG